MNRIEEWAKGRERRIRGVNPAWLVFRVVKRFGEVRVTGLAAEMSYYALISLIPLTIALGASLGFLQALLGVQQALLIEDAIVGAVAGVLSPELTEDVVEPMVRGLLHQEYAGVAILGVLATFFLASAVFRAVIRALDDSYQVEERRSGLHLWGLAYALAMGSVLVLTVLLALVVIGPLLGAGADLAEWLGVGEVFEVVWAIGRWPVVFVVGTFYMAWLYGVAPNVSYNWRRSLPGAVAATLTVVLISVGLQVYLALAGPRAPEVGAPTEAVAIAAQTVGAVLAVILWIWLISVVILTGGVLNAELQAEREGRR